MDDIQEELAEELMIMQSLIEENPCKMKHSLLTALKDVVHSFIGKNCIEGASREQVARYFGRDVRTLTRWKNTYADFPVARHNGHKEVSYDWIDIVRWKLSHKELW